MMRDQTSSSHFSIQRSIRVKVTLGVILPLVLILGAFTVFKYLNRDDTVFNNLSLLAANSGQVIESSLHNAMMADNQEEIQHLLNSIGQSDQFQVVYIMDTSGEVIFAPDGVGVGLKLNNHDADCQPCHSHPVAERPASVVVNNQNGQRVFRSMRPIMNSSQCHECHDEEDRLLGLLLTDIPAAPMEAAVNADLRDTVLWWLGTILVTVIVVNIGLNQFVMARLERLAAAITGLGQGVAIQQLPEDGLDEIGQLSQAFNQMVRRIEARELENHRLSEALRLESEQRGNLLKRLISAQESERKRIARELHDELGQSLGGLALQVGLVEHFLKAQPEQIDQQLGQIRSLIQNTTDSMYDMIMDLRPSALDDLGLAPALRDCAERLLQTTDIHCEIDAGGLTRRLPSPVETSLYRVFQESLNNIVRHAEATEVKILLKNQNDYFIGEIRDNGQGFALDSILMDGQDTRGLGLLGIRERVTQCGGEVNIISQPGQGTQVFVRIPLEEESQV